MTVRTDELMTLLRGAQPADDNVRTSCILVYGSGVIVNGASTRVDGLYTPSELRALAAVPQPKSTDRIAELHLMSSASGLCGVERALPVPKSLKALRPVCKGYTRLYLYSKGSTSPIETGIYKLWSSSQVTAVRAPIVGSEMELYWALEKGQACLRGKDIDMMVCLLQRIARRDPDARVYLTGPCSGQNDRLAVIYDALLDSNYRDVNIGIVSSSLSHRAVLNTYSNTLRQMRINESPLIYTEWYYRDCSQAPPRVITSLQPLDESERETFGYSVTFSVDSLLPQTDMQPFYRGPEHLSRFKIRVGSTMKGALGATHKERNCYQEIGLRG